MAWASLATYSTSFSVAMIDLPWSPSSKFDPRKRAGVRGAAQVALQMRHVLATFSPRSKINNEPSRVLLILKQEQIIEEKLAVMIESCHH